MRNLKRFLALTLTMLMIVGCFSFSTSAKVFDDATTDDEYAKYADAIDVLSNIGVITGETETTYNASGKVERWQMALLIAKLFTGNTNNDEWKEATNYTKFTDVTVDQYQNSINYCAGLGIIKGTSATTFEPVANITYQDALTMVVRALGYGDADKDAGYPWTYISAATKLGLTDGIIDVAYEDVITRGATAQILYNAAYATSKTGAKIIGDVFQIVTVVVTEKDITFGGDDLVHVKYFDAYGQLQELSVYTGTSQHIVDLSTEKYNSKYEKDAEREVSGEDDSTVKNNIDTAAYYLPQSQFGGEECDLGDSYVIYSDDNFETVTNVTACDKVFFTQSAVTEGSGKEVFTFNGTTYRVVTKWSYVSNNKNSYNDAMVFVLEDKYDLPIKDNDGNTTGYKTIKNYEALEKSATFINYEYDAKDNSGVSGELAGYAYDDDGDGLYERFFVIDQAAASTDKDEWTAKSKTLVKSTKDVEDNLNGDLKIAGVETLNKKSTNSTGLVTGYDEATKTIYIDGTAYNYVDGVKFDAGSVDTIKETLGKYLSFTLYDEDDDGKVDEVVGIYTVGDKSVIVDNLVAYTTDGYPMYLAYVDGVKTEITVASVNGAFYTAYELPSTAKSYTKNIYKDVIEGFGLYNAVVDDKGFYHLYDGEYTYKVAEMNKDLADAVKNTVSEIANVVVSEWEDKDAAKNITDLAKKIVSEQQGYHAAAALLFYKNNMYYLGEFFNADNVAIDLEYEALTVKNADGNDVPAEWTFIVLSPVTHEMVVKKGTASDFSAITIYQGAEVYINKETRIIYVNNGVITGDLDVDVKVSYTDTIMTSVNALVYVNQKVIDSESVTNKVNGQTIYGYAYSYSTKAFDLISGDYVEIKCMPNFKLEAGKFYTVNNGYVEAEAEIDDSVLGFGKVVSVNKYFSRVIDEDGNVEENIRPMFGEVTLYDMDKLYKDKDGKDTLVYDNIVDTISLSSVMKYDKDTKTYTMNNDVYVYYYNGSITTDSDYGTIPARNLLKVAVESVTVEEKLSAAIYTLSLFNENDEEQKAVKDLMKEFGFTDDATVIFIPVDKTTYEAVSSAKSTDVLEDHKIALSLEVAETLTSGKLSYYISNEFVALPFTSVTNGDNKLEMAGAGNSLPYLFTFYEKSVSYNQVDVTKTTAENPFVSPVSADDATYYIGIVTTSTVDRDAGLTIQYKSADKLTVYTIDVDDFKAEGPSILGLASSAKILADAD